MSVEEPARNLPTMSVIPCSDKAGIANVISVVASAFTTTSISLGLICDLDKVPPPYPSPKVGRSHLHEHFKPQIENLAAAGATLVQAGDFSAIAIWEEPGFTDTRSEDPSIKTGELLKEWRDNISRIKTEFLGDPAHIPDGDTKPNYRPHWHLGFLARNTDITPVPGAISAVVLPFLEKARNENVPAWLEATTPYAVSIYEHFGFRLATTITIGKGNYGPDGWPKEGGEGLTAYAMIYDGHLQAGS